MARDLAIDLGTANTLVYAKGQGIVMNEPTVIALNKRNGDVLAMGREAWQMIGRTPSYIIAVRPLRQGAITDFDITQRMIRLLLQRAGVNGGARAHEDPRRGTTRAGPAPKARAWAGLGVVKAAANGYAVTMPLDPEPSQDGPILPALVWIIQQDRLPTEYQSQERKIRSLLQSGKKDEATAKIPVILPSPSRKGSYTKFR